MHTYELHREVHVPCHCCRVVVDFVFKSTSDHVICKACQRHQGDTTAKALQRDRDHVGLWSSEVQLLREEFDADRMRAREATRELERRLRQTQLENESLKKTLERGFEGAAPADVERILIDQAVREAHEERDIAYSSRDHVYRSLWAVDDLHHDQEVPEHCSCGSRGCPVLKALQPVQSSLYAWENKQITRAQNHRPHGLPRQHPKYTDPDDWGR